MMRKSLNIQTCAAALLVGLAVGLMILPLAAAEPIERRIKVGDTFTVTSERGVAILGEDEEVSREHASLELKCEVTEVGPRGFKFAVKEGAIEIDGTRYVVTSAEGRVHARPRFRGALVDMRGQDQGGEFHLRGPTALRRGETVVGLRGPLETGGTVYRLRFLSTASRPL